jgi:uncharacterized membrane protein
MASDRGKQDKGRNRDSSFVCSLFGPETSGEILTCFRPDTGFRGDGMMMRKLLILLFAANVILWAVSLAVLPARVAIHFGEGGVPDSWASKQSNALLFLALETSLFALFFFAPGLTLRLPEKYLSLPNKKYWLREENRPLFRKMITSKLAEFGAVFFVFLFGVGLLTIRANLADPVWLDESLSLVVFIAFMAYTVVWCVEFIRSFRIPGNTPPGSRR